MTRGAHDPMATDLTADVAYRGICAVVTVKMDALAPV
jgi:hypothetical protein